ncbi:winged helix-turn-helix domain-containing protein [Caballeronia sp. DA-9]|uniref:winged helix-turn-helix domain-containing protein n=1 Tax=Caballeronia sp. DA-9 TaxID=3436237 RepID=UPI003F663787
MPTNVLLVESAPTLAESIRRNLTELGLSVSVAESAERAREMISAVLPDLILLSWTLPGQPGGMFATQLRANINTQKVPLIMVGAYEERHRNIINSRVVPDAHIPRPMDRDDLVARVRAVLRLRQIPRLIDEPITVVGLKIDPTTRKVFYEKDGLQTVLSVGPTEFRILYFLMSNPGIVFSRSQLMEAIWSDHHLRKERSIDIYIRRLRNALAPQKCDQKIEAVRGYGYRFSVD